MPADEPSAEWRALPAAKLADVTLSLGDCLLRLKERCRLQPLLRELVIEAFLLRRASEAGLSVGVQELQAAADDFRRRQGLQSAEQTNAWLAGQGLSVVDFEAALERDLLVARLRAHVTAPLIEEHFSKRREKYDRARLSQIVVARVDLAKELLTQIRREGADFAELAQEHSLHTASRDRGGELGVLTRRQLPADAEVVFAARAGEVVGPVALPDGFHLFHVLQLSPAELDGPTAEMIRTELFDAWLAETLHGARPELTLLERL